MFGTVRKHQKVVWIVIIALTVISFVVFFSPNARLDLAGDPLNLGRINGRALTPEEVRNARAEEALYFRFTRGDWHDSTQARRSQFNIEQAGYNRLIWLEKMKQLKIEVSADATARMIAQMFDAVGKPFPLAEYENKLKEMASHGITKADFERFVRNEVGRQQLVELYGLGGRLVTPQEAEYLYKQENAVISGEVVAFHGTNYEAKVDAGDEKILSYFKLNAGRYHVPEKRQIYYVKYPFSKYETSESDLVTKLKQSNPQLPATNLSQIVEMEYFQAMQQPQKPSFLLDEQTGMPLPPDMAKKKLEKEIRRSFAAQSAMTDVSEFLKALYTYREAAENKADTNFFQKIAAEKSLAISESPLFADGTVPAGMYVKPEFSRAAFNLSLESNPYSAQPVAGEDALYVVALKRVETTYMPQYETIKDEVTKHFRTDEGKKLAFQAADKFSEKAGAGLKAGKSFAEICVAEAVKPVVLPKFTLAKQTVEEWPHATVNLNSVQNATGRTEAGKVSGSIDTGYGAAVLYVKEKAPADPATMAKEIPDFIRTIGEQRQNAAFMQWLQGLSQQIPLELPGNGKEEPKKTAQK